MKALEILNDMRIKYNAHYSKRSNQVIKLDEAIKELEELTTTTTVFPVFRESKLSKGLKVCFISKDTFIVLVEGNSDLADPIMSRGSYVPNSVPYDNFDVWKECEISYPVYFKEYIDNGLIVCFIGKTEGTVIYKGSSSWNIGEYIDHFISCHSGCWKDIYTLPQEDSKRITKALPEQAEQLLSKKEPIMPKITTITNDTISKNKEIFTDAAKLKAGQIINTQLVSLIKPKLPMMVRGYADSPIFTIALANITVIAVKQFMPNNPKLNTVADLMLSAAAYQTIDSFNIEEMVEELLSKIKLPEGVLDLD